MGDIIDQPYLESMFDRRRLADLSNDGQGAKATTIANAIAAAEAEVQNLLSKQYTLTQLQADASIKRCVAVATMYILELRRSDVTKAIALAYDQSLTVLQRLVEGDAKLSGVDQVLPRITQTNASRAFEQSGYFSGYPSPCDDPDLSEANSDSDV